jgi:hypothetical protein
MPHSTHFPFVRPVVTRLQHLQVTFRFTPGCVRFVRGIGCPLPYTFLKEKRYTKVMPDGAILRIPNLLDVPPIVSFKFSHLLPNLTVLIIVGVWKIQINK